MDQRRVLGLLRGEASYAHVKGAVRLVAGASPPFPEGELPLLAEMEDSPRVGYRSGAAGLVVPLPGARWLHAGGVGVPSGGARPSYEAGRLQTYLLGGETGSIWGFYRRSEAEAELERLSDAAARGLPVVKPVGVGVYADTRVLEYMSRVELLDAVLRTSVEERRRRFTDEARSIEAACLLVEEPSDARADELLYGFLHPCVERFLSNRDCRVWLRWLGSSCGLNLRRLHDAGLSHGTSFWRTGHASSCSPVNYVVSPEGTLITDLHLSAPSLDKDLREAEAFLLASAANPLPDAEKGAAQTFGMPKPVIFNLPQQSVEHFSLNPYQTLYARPKESLEEYADAWIEGVAYGYNRRILRDADRKLKEKGMLVAAGCKRDLFRLLSLPDHYERGQLEVAQRYRKFSEEEQRAAEKRLEADLATSRGAA